MDETESKKRSMKPSVSSLKINQIDKPLTRLIKKKTERTNINKIRNKREVTTDTKKKNAKDCKKHILQITVCQQIGQSGRYG